MSRDALHGQSEHDDAEFIEIRVLWSKTDYGHISVLAAGRGFGGRKLGSYQDQIINEDFARLRDHEREVNPTWEVAESVVKVKASSIEALFPGVLTTEAVPE